MLPNISCPAFFAEASNENEAQRMEYRKSNTKKLNPPFFIYSKPNKETLTYYILFN